MRKRRERRERVEREAREAREREEQRIREEKEREEQRIRDEKERIRLANVEASMAKNTSFLNAWAAQLRPPESVPVKEEYDDYDPRVKSGFLEGSRKWLKEEANKDTNCSGDAGEGSSNTVDTEKPNGKGKKKKKENWENKEYKSK